MGPPRSAMCDPISRPSPTCVVYYFKKTKRAPIKCKVLSKNIKYGFRSMQIEKGAEPDTSHISTGLAALGESTIERADEMVRERRAFLSS